MTLRNAFENLALESKQEDILAVLGSLLTELAQKLEQGQQVVASGPLTNTELRLTPPSVKDDFFDGEVLLQQSGANAVLTFTFASDVNLVVVESFGDTLVSRVDPFGGTPSAVLGWPCRHEIPNYFPIITNTVKVYAETGSEVNVIGYRR